ncbi:MAG TPA: hypothetical protein VLF43_02005 [Candidatus Saccharimonadales bacterium]|nr:hypothetical protein [Candidatus Saccharimonadales bacterium]
MNLPHERGEEPTAAIQDFTELAGFAQDAEHQIQARNQLAMAEREVFGAPSYEQVKRSIASEDEAMRAAAAQGEADHPQALARTGLRISLDEPVFVIADGQVFADALHTLPEDCPPQVRDTITLVIDFSLRYALSWELSQGSRVLQLFPGLLAGRDFGSLALMPNNFSKHDLERQLLPDPAQRELVEQATKQAEQADKHAKHTLPEKLRSIGVAKPLVERFRGFSLAAQEGLLTEWAISAELGAFEDYTDRGLGHPWGLWGQIDWKRAYSFLQHLARQAAPNSQFVAYVRDNMLTRIKEQRQRLVDRPDVSNTLGVAAVNIARLLAPETP